MKKTPKHRKTVDKGLRSRLKKQDYILLALILAGIGLLFFLQLLSLRGDGATISVTVDGENYGAYSLSTDTVIDIKNAQGQVTNTLTIRDGAAKMTDADCPDKYCLHQKKINLPGESIVCLPNRVLVSVTGGEPGELDAVTR